MKNTGQILKENRERKGISISEVAIATKINNRTIIAMEEGDLKQLPPKTFLRGFVRAYAGYLELDVESVMATFYEEMGSTRPEPVIDHNAAATKPPGSSEPEAALNPKASITVKIAAVAGILLLVVLIVFFKNKMESYEREAVIGEIPPGITSVDTSGEVGATPSPDATPNGDSSAETVNGEAVSGGTVGGEAPSPTPSAIEGVVAPSMTPGPTPVPTPEATPVPTTTPVSSVGASPKPTSTPSPTPVAAVKPIATLPTATPSPTPKASPTPKPTATPAPTPAPTPSPTPSPTPEATPTPSPTPKASPTPARAKPQEIIIEALGEVDVDAQIDNDPNLRTKLRAEQVHTIRAKRKVVLKFSNGGAVNLIVNGVERGVPGDLGKPLRLEIP